MASACGVGCGNQVAHIKGFIDDGLMREELYGGVCAGLGKRCQIKKEHRKISAQGERSRKPVPPCYAQEALMVKML